MPIYSAGRMNSFSEPSPFVFYTRLLPVLVLSFMIGFVSVGFLSHHPALTETKWEVKNGVFRLRAPEPSSSISLFPVWETVEVGARFTDHLLNFPPYCRSGKSVNEFQEQQCADFLTVLLLEGVILLIPFLVVLLVLMGFVTWMKSTYQRIQALILSRRAQAVGKIQSIHPKEKQGDFWRKFLCLTPYLVVLESGEERVVYFAPAMGRLQLGDSVAIFELKSSSSAQRYIGIPYAPHIAVIRAV